MNRDEARGYALAWAEDWNRRDLAAVLAHFADDVVFCSPKAVPVTGGATVVGKAALLAYWQTALRRIGSLRFDVERVLWDEATRELAILYDRVVDGQADRVAEILRFGDGGLVVRGEVLYGVTPSG